MRGEAQRPPAARGGRNHVAERGPAREQGQWDGGGAPGAGPVGEALVRRAEQLAQPGAASGGGGIHGPYAGEAGGPTTARGRCGTPSACGGFRSW